MVKVDVKKSIVEINMKGEVITSGREKIDKPNQVMTLKNQGRGTTTYIQFFNPCDIRTMIGHLEVMEERLYQQIENKKIESLNSMEVK